jgi:acyl carrier protein
MRTYHRIENRIKNVIVNEFKLVKRYLSAETNLKEDLGLDEYDMIFLSLALENEFQVILEQQIFNTFSIKDTVHYVTYNLLMAKRSGNYLNKALLAHRVKI